MGQRGVQKRVSAAEAKRRVLAALREGASPADAVLRVERSYETYRSWRKSDPAFRAESDEIKRDKAWRKRHDRAPVPPFDEFCRDWLNQPLFPHQLRMWDVIEGRPPRDLDPAMSYEPGYNNRTLILTPPNHGKSTTFSVNYVVWRILCNPDIRVVIISQGQELARTWLYEIKLKLTSPVYREMHRAFAPEGGWRDPDAPWTTDAIYVRGKNTATLGDGSDVQKDPTVQVLGMRGQIYGRRADLILMDDVVTTTSAKNISYQMRMLERDIESRLPPDDEGAGQLVILGTRVASTDMYRTLDDIRDADDRRVWTLLRQPAVLNYGTGDSSTWTTLWPFKWSGPSLARRRRDSNWNLVWQQLNMDSEMTFSLDAVNASVNGSRMPGPQMSGLKDSGAHRDMLAGMYRVAGLDPAATGNTAIVVAALDRETGKRYVLDGWNHANASAAQIIAKFKELTETYRLHEWVIERNGLQRFIAQLPETTDFARTRGCKVSPHYTTEKSKFDSDWGVQSMAPLFDAGIEVDEHNPNVVHKTGHGLIELPSLRGGAWVNELFQQLTIWAPSGMSARDKTDLVMALWFTHLAFVKIIGRARRNNTHYPSPFLSRGRSSRQGVVNLAELRAAKREAEMIA